MNICISNNSDCPIYEQIKEQIKEQILNGFLEPGAMLPSMRLLAKELRISIITTKRAYEDLEKEGYIESFTGRGSFVKDVNSEVLRENLLYEIEEHFDAAIGKSKVLDLSYEELCEILRALYMEEE